MAGRFLGLAAMAFGLNIPWLYKNANWATTTNLTCDLGGRPICSTYNFTIAPSVDPASKIVHAICPLRSSLETMRPGCKRFLATTVAPAPCLITRNFTTAMSNNPANPTSFVWSPIPTVVEPKITSEAQTLPSNNNLRSYPDHTAISTGYSKACLSEGVTPRTTHASTQTIGIVDITLITVPQVNPQSDSDSYPKSLDQDVASSTFSKVLEPIANKSERLEGGPLFTSTSDSWLKWVEQDHLLDKAESLKKINDQVSAQRGSFLPEAGTYDLYRRMRHPSNIASIPFSDGVYHQAIQSSTGAESDSMTYESCQYINLAPFDPSANDSEAWKEAIQPFEEEATQTVLLGLAYAVSMAACHNFKQDNSKHVQPNRRLASSSQSSAESPSFIDTWHTTFERGDPIKHDTKGSIDNRLLSSGLGRL